MAMTEKQGGSDVRANTTRAEPAGGDEWELTGHKWFCSYPPCDVFLTLAQAPAGLSCFVFESSDPGFRIQRLKDKLGTRSLPSSEVEFHGVRGRLVGEEGRGVPTIIRMVNHTRLDCLLGSAASMRWGLAQAVHHARHRSAFGELLADQPLMRNVLADLAIESEAATVTAMRMARAYDEDRRALPPLRHRGHEVLGLQAGAAARDRGARVPGRQRLRGGVRHAAAVPRLAAQLDLGGLGQRGGARRAARAGQGARGPAGLPRRVRAGGRRRPPARRSPRAREGDDGVARQRRRSAVRGTPGGGGRWRWRSRRRCWSATPRPRWPTPSAPARLGDGGRAYGTLPPGVAAEAIVERALAV